MSGIDLTFCNLINTYKAELCRMKENAETLWTCLMQEEASAVAPRSTAIYTVHGLLDSWGCDVPRIGTGLPPSDMERGCPGWHPCTCGGVVVQEDVRGRQCSLPDDELVEGPGDVVAVVLLVAGSDDQVGVGVAVVVGLDAGGVPHVKGAVDVHLQTF